MKKEFKLLYGVFSIIVLAIATIGATYAYWTASAVSANNAINTQSTIYSISMKINPLYHDFSMIPMNDEDALKALKNSCKDKYNRGACSAYSIYVYDYNADLDFISGVMDITTNNMQNLSYMMLRISDTYDENNCVVIEGKTEEGTPNNENYCIVKEATHMGDGVGLSLGDSYDVIGIPDTKFILLIWLSNLNQSQNNIDIGNFNAIITMQAGNGGEIKGTIASSLIIDGESNIDSNQNE